MTKIFNPLGRTMQRRDFLKVAGASVAIAALPAAVSRCRSRQGGAVVVGAGSPASGRHVQRRASGHPGRTRECRPGDPEYQAVRAGLQAGSGLPDVVQIEFQHLESFRQVDAFADIGQ